MWINPEPVSNEPPETALVASANVRDFRFNRVRFCSAPVSLDFDALRIGTSFADVAPPESHSTVSGGTQPTANGEKRFRSYGLSLIVGGLGWLGLLVLGAGWFVRSRKRI